MKRFFFLGFVLAVSVYADGAILDQSWEQAIKPPWANSIYTLSPIGQEFTPTADNIVAVELAISGDFLNQQPGDISDLTVRIRQDTIAGTVVAHTTVDAAADAAFMDLISGPTGWGWLKFEFSGPALLTPGNLYVVEASMTEMGGLNWLWEGWVANGSVLPGRAISAGEPSTGTAARGFRTYYDVIPEPATIFLLGLGGLMLRGRISNK